MEIKDKVDILDQMFTIYDDFLADKQVACEKGCDSCCTRNVTLTTLEGFRLLDRMGKAQHDLLLSDIRTREGNERFMPRLTINQMAAMCAQGKEIPEEENRPEWGSCPLLTDALCPVYENRPFGCRCMVSRANCAQTGYADMDPLILSVNDVFLQYIEHIDALGYSGNFIDILLFLDTDQNRHDYLNSHLNKPASETGLIPNHPVQVLMIPPEHRKAVAPILEAFRSIRPRG
ncbi:MAG: hypothetical protein HKM93_16370 [Desulfobacteraceae bacterium]|nr:hypothetical protein [Desulfobacteraceae bacterium]